MESGLICGNGLAWSPDNKTCECAECLVRKYLLISIEVYLNDSVAMKVFAYDFDLESGNITNKRLFIDRTSTFGDPDGMVVE